MGLFDWFGDVLATVEETDCTAKQALDAYDDYAKESGDTKGE